MICKYSKYSRGNFTNLPKARGTYHERLASEDSYNTGLSLLSSYSYWVSPVSCEGMNFNSHLVEFSLFLMGIFRTESNFKKFKHKHTSCLFQI